MEWKFFGHVLALEKCCNACPLFASRQHCWDGKRDEAAVLSRMSSAGLASLCKWKCEHSSQSWGGERNRTEQQDTRPGNEAEVDSDQL